MFEPFRKHMLCAVVVALCRTARAEVHADVDPRMGAMAVDRAPIPNPIAGQPNYFAQPIPRTLHRIHLSADAAEGAGHDGAWRAFADQIGYELRVWGPADLPELEALMEPRLAALVQEAWNTGHAVFVSHVVRITVLAALGGIFVDDALWPPHDETQWVDFNAVVPLQGLVVTTVWHGRNIKRASLFASDGLVMAAPDHPVLRHLLGSLVANHLRLTAHGLSFAENYDGGIFAFNRALAGTMTVVSVRQWCALGMFENCEGPLALVGR